MVDQAGTFVHTETLDSSHSPFISQPDKLAEAIERSIKKIVDSQ